MARRVDFLEPRLAHRGEGDRHVLGGFQPAPRGHQDLVLVRLGDAGWSLPRCRSRLVRIGRWRKQAARMRGWRRPWMPAAPR